MLVPAAIAKILKAEGVKYLFAYPLNPIIEAAAAEDIRTIIVRQERTGVHMADAFSRMTPGDEIGVFVMQHGPGAENSFGGIAQAFGGNQCQCSLCRPAMIANWRTTARISIPH